MSPNAATCLLGDDDFDPMLSAAHFALKAGGFLAFETRNPAARAWTGWNRSTTLRETNDRTEGRVQAWTELVEVRWPFVDYRTIFSFEDESVAVSESTLCYRDQHEIGRALRHNGFRCVHFRDAPDRPGREWIVLARRI